MPLLDDALTIWEIGFRWAGKDPGRPWPLIPTEVTDTFRSVVRAIDRGDLYCATLKIDTNLDSPELEAYVEYIATTIADCIEGARYSRKFLRAHSISRWEFAQWCDKAGIPLPEFWFSPGWTAEKPGYPKSARQSADQVSAVSKTMLAAGEPVRDRRSNDAIWDEARAAAKAIWADAGSIPSMEVARRIHKNKQLSASRFSPDSIRKRIADLAPPEFRGKAGRPKAKKSS